MTGWLNWLYGENKQKKTFKKEDLDKIQKELKTKLPEMDRQALRHGSPKFDRVAYQREYMRRRRAKAKENASL